MADLLPPIQRLDDLFSAATVAHEYVERVHRRLVELDADDEHTRELLRMSADITLYRMPLLVRDFRERQCEWDEQQILDPDAAQRTLTVLTERLAELEPALMELRAQQDQAASELLRHTQAAREN